MKLAWAEIERLIAANALHRKGFRIGEVSAQHVLDQALGCQGNIDELGDLLGILFHYAIKQGWTMEQLEQSMLAKFKIRFTDPEQYDFAGFRNCRIVGPIEL